MKLPQARFITSATKIENCPPSDGRPEFAVVGRSNVGKSSLINTLAHQKTLAKTSRTPGRTQLINFFDFGPFVLVDLPGYGYAKVSHSTQDYWRRELSRFLKNRPALMGVVHLMDARHPLQENDRQMREFLLEAEVPLLVVLTKVDDVKQGDLAKAVRMVREETDQDPILFSSRSGRGRKELLTTLVHGAPEEEELGSDEADEMGVEEIEDAAGDD